MSTKTLILNYLEEHSDRYVSGTELEGMAIYWETKGSTISRRARELADDLKIERKLSDKRTVQYRHQFKETLF